MTATTPASTNGESGDWLDDLIRRAAELTPEQEAEFWAVRRREAVITNERIDAVNALEMAAEWLEVAETDPERWWKWAIIAVHNAVQGFMILAIAGSWPVTTLHRKDRNRMIKAAHDQRIAISAGDHARAEKELEATFDPEAGLAAFMQLYARIKDPEGAMRQFMHSEVFEPRATDEECMDCLNETRGMFVHHKVESGDFLFTMLVAAVESGLHVIDFLLKRSNNMTWYSHDEELDLENRAHAALDRATAAVLRLQEAYADLPRLRAPYCGSLPQIDGDQS